jgi:DNA-binding MarR family transcriptional regulator
VAQAAGCDGDNLMIMPVKPVPEEVLKDSVLAHIAAAYFAVGKRLERKTQCSATRGFILSTLRAGAVLNQNQIATLLGLDRTVVHRSIKLLVKEGLVSEKKAETGKAIHLQLTRRGEHYRNALIRHRRAADEKVGKALTAQEHATLVRLLKLIAELDF